MAEMRALCLEDLDAEATRDSRFMQCVALVGSRGGLAFDAEGRLSWDREPALRAAELWVSADDRLMLRRPAGGLDVSVKVSRLGRELLVPRGKPVILKHGDTLQLAGRALRLHIHGVAPAVHAPQPYLSPAELAGAGLGRRVARAAAALALGTAVGAAGVGVAEAATPDQNDDVITVRDRPPDVAMPPQKPKKPKTPKTPKKPAKPKKPGKKKPAKKPAKPKS